MNNLLLLSRREVGQRVVFDGLPLVVALLAILHVCDLLLFVVVVLRGDRRLHVRHIGGVVSLARLL